MSQKITWRRMEDRDQAAVDAMHVELEKKVGRKLDRPNLMERPVIETVVGEVNGVVEHGMYAEAEIEVCSCGPNVLAPEQMREGVAMLMKTARDYQIRIARCSVPTSMMQPTKRGRKPAIERMLTKLGFTCEDDSVRRFFRWLIQRGN